MFTPAPDALPPQRGIKNYFFVPKYSLAAIGIDPTSMKRTIFNRPLAWIPMLIITALCFPIMIYASQYINDLNLVTEALTPIWQCMLAPIKIAYFIYQKDKFVQLVRKIWLWNLEASGKELQIIAEENRKDTMFSIFFYCCVLITGILALIAPFLISLYYYYNGYKFWDFLETPLKAHYFVNTKALPGYLFAYFWVVLSIYFVLNGTLGMDSLFSWYMHNVSAQFRILNLRLKTLANETMKIRDDTDNAMVMEEEERFRKSLSVCIQYHRRIIELAENFNDVFMVTVFIKFTISFLQMACMAFQLSRSGELAAKIFQFSFLTTISLQLMLYCYGGQKIQDESTSVAFAVYDYFKWHDLSIKSKKLLLMPLIRAQKPCIITGIFFIADLRLFLWVLKTAGSFITMLMTLAT